MVTEREAEEDRVRRRGWVLLRVFLSRADDGATHVLPGAAP